MALRGTLTHWKTRLLATSLGIMPCMALGILEALWHVTAELAPAGNIGRLPNKAIAMEMFYDGDADALIAALIESGHLDENKEHRLIVHDWSQHADYNTKRKVTRRNDAIINNDGSRLVMTRHESIPEPVPVPEPVPEKPRPSRDKRESDSRHGPFRKVLDGYWSTHNQTEMPWSGGEAKAMAELLAANPSMTEAEFRRLLGNRHKSMVNHAERPRAWLANITNYGNGPLDRFGKPLEAPAKPHSPEPGIYQGDKTDDAWVNEWRAKKGLAPLEANA